MPLPTRTACLARSAAIAVTLAAIIATAALAQRPEPLAGARRGASGPSAPSVVDRVVHDLCNERVALLGESPTHGLGRTMQFKAQIVRRLVDECDYSALFFESGAYDFLNIQRMRMAGESVTQPMITAAIGGLWANRDVAPLIPFLADRLQSGALVLAGLDDQLARGTYAQNQMPADLVRYLDGKDRTRCLAILQRHTLWQYTSQAPYGANDKAAILGCLDAIEARLSAPRPGAAAYDSAMIENLRRTLARDFEVDPIRQFNDRDASMYRNFVLLTSRLPRGAKIIVWTAANHAAKDLRQVPGQERRVPLGSYIHRDFERDAFALAFSAYRGSYARAGQPVRQLDPAPDGSLEARAFADGDTSTQYVDPARIRAFGRVAARPVGTAFTTSDWSNVLDGLVVFWGERPPRGF